MTAPLGRDLPTPLHKADTGQHLLLCLAGIRDGEPHYVPHGHDDDPCRLTEEKGCT